MDGPSCHSGNDVHTAVGGERLSLLGGKFILTWLRDVSEIGPRLNDLWHFEPTDYIVDSAGRAVRMGRRAYTVVTIGNLLYE